MAPKTPKNRRKDLTVKHRHEDPAMISWFKQDNRTKRYAAKRMLALIAR